MRSLWGKNKRDKEDSREAAQAALDSANADLQTIRNRSSEVAQLVKAFDDFRERNHLGEALEALILQAKRTP